MAVFLSGSHFSRFSKRQLEEQATLLKQESQMIVDEQKKTKTAKNRSQNNRIETLTAKFQNQKLLKFQQKQIQIEKVNISSRASFISASLMSMATEQDENSDVKGWLEQSFKSLEDQVKLKEAVYFRNHPTYGRKTQGPRN